MQARWNLGRRLRPSSGSIATILLWQSPEEFAQAPLCAELDLRRVVLGVQAKTSLTCVEAGSLGEVVDTPHLVHAPGLGEQPSGKL